jgi:hypothetical protein
MNIRNIERSAIDGWLRLVRLPISAATQLLPNSDEGARNGAILAIDRADAAVRELLGRALRDDELQTDAQRRKAAADERARAIALRVEAAELKADSDRELAERQEKADELREHAAKTAAAREKQAEQERQERKQRVRQTAAKQQAAVEHARDEKQKVAEQKAKRERLSVLDEQADALDTEADALVATDEAQRLAKAAAAAKATRKGTS